MNYVVQSSKLITFLRSNTRNCDFQKHILFNKKAICQKIVLMLLCTSFLLVIMYRINNYIIHSFTKGFSYKLYVKLDQPTCTFKLACHLLTFYSTTYYKLKLPYTSLLSITFHTSKHPDDLFPTRGGTMQINIKCIYNSLILF